jgi:hypothetical protein
MTDLELLNECYLWLTNVVDYGDLMDDDRIEYNKLMESLKERLKEEK